jgi:hypothetical protein
MIARGLCIILEPVLILVLALHASNLAFPFAIIKGKAYSTSRQIFEAENQAAVLGVCSLKIQLCLDKLVEHTVISSNN